MYSYIHLYFLYIFNIYNFSLSYIYVYVYIEKQSLRPYPQNGNKPSFKVHIGAKATAKELQVRDARRRRFLLELPFVAAISVRRIRFSARCFQKTKKTGLEQ